MNGSCAQARLAPRCRRSGRRSPSLPSRVGYGAAGAGPRGPATIADRPRRPPTTEGPHRNLRRPQAGQGPANSSPCGRLGGTSRGRTGTDNPRGTVTPRGTDPREAGKAGLAGSVPARIPRDRPAGPATSGPRRRLAPRSGDRPLTSGFTGGRQLLGPVAGGSAGLGPTKVPVRGE